MIKRWTRSNGSWSSLGRVALLMWLASSAGCWFKATPVAVKPAPTPVPTVTQFEAGIGASQEILKTAESTGADDASTQAETQHEPGDSATEPSTTESDGTSNAAGSSDAEPANGESTTAATATEPPAPPTASKQRLLLLLPDGPLVVDLWVTLDERPLGQSLDETLARLLTEADADKDGRVMWDEITRQPAFQRGVYGNQPVGADNDRRQVIQRYDWNRDKVVSRDELLRWLVREPHRAKPIVVDSRAGSSRDGSLTDSPLLKCLDTNADGQLDDDELAAAARLLMRRDADEDETLDRTDLVMTARMPNEANAGRTDGSGPSVLLLGAKVDWESFQRTMQNAYSLGGPLGPDSWPGAAELFQQLDRNGDHLIGRSEWVELVTVSPSLTLDVRLGSPGDKLELREIDPQWKSFVGEGMSPGTLRLNLPQCRVEIVLSPSSVPDFKAQAAGVLAMFDADKNGYLEESESEQAIMTAGGTFAEIDTDGDGKVYEQELTAALRKRQSIVVEQMRVLAGFREDAWWQAADSDGDDRLDAREIDTLGQRLKALDRDGDGAISRDEVPTTYVLAISRGAGDGQAGGLPRAQVAPVAAGDVPAWFTHMDSNGDRLITRREFLGDAELFRKLDRNADGRLEWSELRDLASPP